MKFEEDIKKSRDFEMNCYLRETKNMYENAILQNGEIFDIAFENTRKFSTITGDAILADSRIIKILRYIVTPSISQMKFGQIFGMNSIGKFEDEKLQPNSNKYKELEKISFNIADFINKNIDKKRFIWLINSISDTSLAYEYSKNWTCSLLADQNAQTNYRNWRKDLQEHAIIDKLINRGYVKTKHSGTLEKDTDLGIGEYSNEIKVKGRTIQKADIAFRSKITRKLVLIEAKAVGVELDATKRIKECSDKASDWKSSKNLGEPIILATIAGFFTQGNLENLLSSGVSIIWEHDLDKMDKFA